MARTTRTDWLDVGLVLLREGGEDAVTVERMCTRLERTKGAFYHHFEDVDDYLDALLQHWAGRQTLTPIAVSEAGRTTQERRRLLEHTVRGLDMALERAMRAWALRARRAERVLRKVDARRADYLAELYRAEGVRRAKARVLARLEYAAFLGVLQIFPDLRARDARHVEAALRRALVLLVKDHGPR
jgi:AcrR family transcriptional regulator